MEEEKTVIPSGGGGIDMAARFDRSRLNRLIVRQMKRFLSSPSLSFRYSC